MTSEDLSGLADDFIMDNTKALNTLASRLDKPFRIPLPYAPGASFVGAMVRPGVFGLAGHPDVGAAGRGVTPEQAFRSCMGEAAEYLSFIEREADPLLAQWCGLHGLSEAELNWALAGIGLEPDHKLDTLDWIEAVRLGEESKVCFPSELVLRRPAELRSGRRPAESTGMGAGATFEQAIISGLMEAVERDAFALWWFGSMEARRLTPTCLPGGDFEEFADSVRQDAGRPHWLLDITSDLEIPTVACVSSFPDGEAAIAGFSAHPNPLRAAQSAFLEMCQMELAQQLSLMKRQQQGEVGLAKSDRAWIDRFESLSTDAFPSLRGGLASGPNWRTRSANEIDYCLSRLSSAGLSAYVVDLRRVEINVATAKVIVPGLQSANPEWPTARLLFAAEKTSTILDNISEKLSPI